MIDHFMSECLHPLVMVIDCLQANIVFVQTHLVSVISHNTVKHVYLQSPGIILLSYTLPKCLGLNSGTTRHRQELWRDERLFHPHMNSQA